MKRNTTKKICHISSVHETFAARIFYKEAKTLRKRGHNVSLIVQHDKNVIVNGIRIIALQKAGNRFERMTKTVWKLFILALKENADVYHFHDPELIPIGLLLKVLRKKVVYDVHELVFFQLEDKYWLKFRFVKKFVQRTYLLFEKLSVTIFDQLILAEDDYENYYKEIYKNSDKYTTIRNFPLISLIGSAKTIDNGVKGKQVIIYAGGLTGVRGIREIIKSMEYVGDTAELWLLGRWENKDFEKECKALVGWRYAKYLGLIPLTRVYQYMKIADIGISVLHPIRNYVTSLPIKAFEYMACSLPVVMSNFPYWQEIFEKCALFADPYNPKDIAEKISCLLENFSTAKELGRKGRELIEEKYNWEAESLRLIGLYEKLLK